MLATSKSHDVTRTADPFTRTYSGRKFFLLNPEPESIAIQDIAHALSLICRWTGHTYCFYSVAEHSLRVSTLAWEMFVGQAPRSMLSGLFARCVRRVALWGLLHDASEAYLCDLPSPLKRTPGLGYLYKQHERQLMSVIAERFDLQPQMPAMVKEADRILLNTEARDLMGVSDAAASEWGLDGQRLPDPIYPMDAQRAEAEFLRRFEELTELETAL